MTVEATPGTITVAIPALEDGPVPVPGLPVASAPPPFAPVLVAAEPPVTVPAVALASAGALGVVMGAMFALRYRSENEQARGLCAQSLCTSVAEKSRHEALVARAGGDRTMAFVGAGVGVVAMLAAAYLRWWQW